MHVLQLSSLLFFVPWVLSVEFLVPHYMFLPALIGTSWEVHGGHATAGTHAIDVMLTLMWFVINLYLFAKHHAWTDVVSTACGVVAILWKVLDRHCENTVFHVIGNVVASVGTSALILHIARYS